MEILWLAIVLYSIGLGLVLHFKPALMFNENGSWKEFGYQRSQGDKSRHTLFPFWLFAITWAFASYAVAAGISWIVPAAGLVATASATSSSLGSYSPDEYSDSEEEEEEAATPVSKVTELPKRGRGRPRKTEAAKPRSGYYVIDPEAREGGLRKYIYYGSEPPPEEVA